MKFACNTRFDDIRNVSVDLGNITAGPSGKDLARSRRRRDGPGLAHRQPLALEVGSDRAIPIRRDDEPGRRRRLPKHIDLERRAGSGQSVADRYRDVSGAALIHHRRQVTVRLLPLPPKTIPFVPINDVSEEEADSVKLPAGVSASPMVNRIAAELELVATVDWRLPKSSEANSP